MKKLIIVTLAAISLLTGVAIAQVNSEKNNIVISMFAQFHDLSDYQQELMMELVKSGKSLALEVKKPKQHIKNYLESMVEMDNIDVAKVMEESRNWQKLVDKQFEKTLHVAAKLHADLSIEQRKKLVATLKEMHAK